MGESESIEMVWPRGENGSVPYGLTGVDGVCKWRAGTG